MTCLYGGIMVSEVPLGVLGARGLDLGAGLYSYLDFQRKGMPST